MFECPSLGYPDETNRTPQIWRKSLGERESGSNYLHVYGYGSQKLIVSRCEQQFHVILVGTMYIYIYTYIHVHIYIYTCKFDTEKKSTRVDNEITPSSVFKHQYCLLFTCSNLIYTDQINTKKISNSWKKNSLTLNRIINTCTCVIPLHVRRQLMVHLIQ